MKQNLLPEQLPEQPFHFPAKALSMRLGPFFILMILVAGFSMHCGKKNRGPQPTLDSAYIVRYMESEPAFRDQVIWAKNFYRERNFRLGWFKDHEIRPEAEEMLAVISKAAEEGLDPADYQVVDFGELFKQHRKGTRDTSKRNDLERRIDVALSATYFNWASDYYRGLVIPRENPDLIDWDVKRNKIKLHKALATIL
ncbi:MAG TPA: hypothetical protein VGD92_01655, partial [Sphingobacteriaceae bacterium]